MAAPVTPGPGNVVMIRVLAVLFALALVAFVYVSRGALRVRALHAEQAATKPNAGSGVASSAQATKSTASGMQAAAPQSVSAPMTPAAPSGIAFGLSFALTKDSTPAIAQFSCHGEPAVTDRPHHGSCNPYNGDTSCRTVLPIACFKPTGADEPAGLVKDGSTGWTGGQLGATQAVMGAILHSEKEASARCEAELGSGWSMAEFHAGGGWAFQGERGPGIRPDTRYWVHVNDSRGNCWDSAP